jgi:hypothetical protein
MWMRQMTASQFTIAVNLKMQSRHSASKIARRYIKPQPTPFGHAAQPMLPDLSLWLQGHIHHAIALSDEKEHGFRIRGTAECRLEVL